jgi:AsmA family protein
MRLRTVLFVLLGLVILVVGGLAAVLAFVDFGKYKDLAAAKVEEATGRKLRIATDPKLTILPMPSLVVKNVGFANAPWGTRPEMATLGELSAEIDLVPLLSGKLRISRLRLKNVDLLLETDAKGRGNWDLLPPGGAPPASSPPPETAAGGGSATTLPAIDDVEFDDIAVAYRNGQTGKVMTASLKKLVAKGAADNAIKIEATLAYEATPIEVRATVGELASLLAPGRPYPIDAEIKAVGATVKASGTLAEPLAGRGLALNLAIDGKDLSTLGALAGATLPAKPYHLAAALAGDADGTLAMKPLQVELGASRLAGEASVATKGVRPKLVAKLDAPMIDTTEFPQGKSGSAPPPAAKDDGRVFSADKLALDGLQQADADVTLAIAAVKTPSLALQNVAVHAVLDNGRLHVDPYGIELAGSRFGGTLDLATRQTPPALSFALDAKHVDFGKLLVTASGTDLIEAKGDIDVAVHGAGDSVRAIMASLDGTSSVVLGRGIIKSRYADVIGADLFREAFAFATGKNDTKLNCMVSRFVIQKGLATAHGLILDTEEMTVSGKGTINLATEQLDLELAPRPKQTSLINLATPIDVTGTLKHPSALPNKVAAAKQVAVGVATVINPLIALAPLVLDSGGDKNPCLAAADNAGKAPAAKKDEGGVGGAVKGIGRTLDSLFK